VSLGNVFGPLLALVVLHEFDVDDEVSRSSLEYEII